METDQDIDLSFVNHCLTCQSFFLRLPSSDTYPKRTSVQANTMTPLISIIIPIYNTEKYLEQCLESIASQTLKILKPSASMTARPMAHRKSWMLSQLRTPASRSSASRRWIRRRGEHRNCPCIRRIHRHRRARRLYRARYV